MGILLVRMVGDGWWRYGGGWGFRGGFSRKWRFFGVRGNLASALSALLFGSRVRRPCRLKPSYVLGIASTANHVMATILNPITAR